MGLLSRCTQQQAPNPLLYSDEHTQSWYLETDFIIGECETKPSIVTSRIRKTNAV